MQQPTHTAKRPDGLQQLLDQNLLFPPEYNGRLSNHLPMALHALQRLGASPERLREFSETYLIRFDKQVPPERGIAADDWHSLRGRHDSFAALGASFTRLLTDQPHHVVLRLALPDLISGMAAAAFHGPIRLAHAIESGHPGELAFALAYWAWRWQPLTPPPPSGLALPFPIWSMRLSETATSWRPTEVMISDNMEAATYSIPYIDLAGALACPTDMHTGIAAFAHWSADRYLYSRSFTILHLMTGLRALRTLMPFMSDPGAIWPTLVYNVTAAYLAADITPFAPRALMRTPSWRLVVDAAIRSNDEHVIKLVDTCREENAVYGNSAYLHVAALAVSQRL